LSEGTAEWLAGLADVAACCRSTVERDPRDREVALVPAPEAPGRLASGLAQLTRALMVMGVPEEQRRTLVAKVALDGMTKGEARHRRGARVRPPGHDVHRCAGR
jgi:hypothetical protein